jgi:hypothetical protein
MLLKKLLKPSVYISAIFLVIYFSIPQSWLINTINSLSTPIPLWTVFITAFLGMFAIASVSIGRDAVKEFRYHYKSILLQMEMDKLEEEKEKMFQKGFEAGREIEKEEYVNSLKSLVKKYKADPEKMIWFIIKECKKINEEIHG